MSDSVRPRRQQPTRLLRPWDSPGKSTGVGCHCLLQCIKVKSESEVTQSCPTLSDPTDCTLTRLLRPWDSPGKSTGVGCHCLLQTQSTTGFLMLYNYKGIVDMLGNWYLNTFCLFKHFKYNYFFNDYVSTFISYDFCIILVLS